MGGCYSRAPKHDNENIPKTKKKGKGKKDKAVDGNGSQQTSSTATDPAVQQLVDNVLKTYVYTKPIINEAIFESLMSCDDDASFVTDLVTQYFQQVADKTKEMHQLLEAKNLEAFAKVAHFVKSSSATIGVERVQSVCTYLQQYGQAGANQSEANLKYLLPIFENIFAESSVELKSRISKAKEGH
eukprot:Colp12_sorted_trinity150504_noHs@31798